MKLSLRAVFAALICAAGIAHAACPSYQEVMSYVLAYHNRLAVTPIAHIKTATEAYCAQGMVAAEIGRSMGVPAGYKAAFTSASVQQQAGVSAPLRGFLFEKMFLRDGASLPADFGALPQVSADLIVVVRDGDIQKATTPLAVLQHVSHVVPFIELSDAMLRDGHNTLALIASNVGTRYGVLGAPIAVEPTQQFLDQLAAMQVVMTDLEGNAIGNANGSSLLGNPVNAIMWLGKELQYNAQRIQPGDMLSLGAFFPPSAPRAGTGVKVQYLGLPGDPSVSVRFEEKTALDAR